MSRIDGSVLAGVDGGGQGEPRRRQREQQPHQLGPGTGHAAGRQKKESEFLAVFSFTRLQRYKKEKESEFSLYFSY